MATSWATETDDKVNYTKLCRLLYDGGTLAVRTVFDGKCPPASLGATLTTNRSKLQSLKKPVGKVLSQNQWNLLYPPSGANHKSEDFDITLLFVLLRNICRLTPPATGWDALPPLTDTSLEAKLVRIKYYRNDVTAHSSKAEVDDTLFEAYWSDISGALVSLGLKQDDIDELKSSPLGTKDYKQLVEYWYLSDAEIIHQQEAIKTGISEIKTELSDIKSKMPGTQGKSEISKLANIDFTNLIQRSCKFYHQTTRQWIFNQVEENVEQSTAETSVVLIRAGPGMGKSVVAAKICAIYQKGGFLGGCHFFQHSNSLRNNPRMMLQSIARQLCNSLTGYQAALETKLKTLEGNISDLNCEELFGVLFEEPLSQICIDHNVVIVIDALDECASQFKEEFEDVLNRKLSDLPSWIQFVITTRPLPSCRNLSPIVQIEIEPSDPRNIQDLREFFTFELAERNAQNSIDKLMEIANGSFLVAHFVLEILDEGGNESIQDVLQCFPHGISSVYKYYFTRIHKVITPFIHISESEDDSFFKMLEAMVAAKSPLPKKMFYEILKLKSVEEVQRRNQMERNEAVHLLHTIFPVENDHVNVFHKTVIDWLNLDGENEHKFCVSASNGCEELAQKSLDVLKDFREAVKEGKKPFDQPLVLSDKETFALGFGLEYIDKSSKLSQFKKDEIIYDFTIVAAILSYLHQVTHAIYFEVSKWGALFGRLYSHPEFYLMTIYMQSYNPYTLLVLNNQKPLFGHCLSIVGDVCSSRNTDLLPTTQKQELLRLRINHRLPYYTFHSVFSSLPIDDDDDDDGDDDDDDNDDDDDDDDAFQHQTFCSFLDLYQITNGFVAVNVDPDAEPPTSTVLNIKDDGSFGEHKNFSSVQVRGISPDKKFLIITKTDSSKIELLDVTTLEKVREYNCPINRAESCYIFGDEQWYIVLKAQGDPKIHILDGLNGQLHGTIEVGKNEKIRGVSQCGRILICDTSDLSFDNIHTIHFKKTDEKIYYYPLSVYNLYYEIQNMVFKFSDNGEYFALYFDYSVHVFQTNDGTLLTRILVQDVTEIVFLSFPCLIIRISFGILSLLKFYNFINDRLMYVTNIDLTKQYRLLVTPQHHTDKPILSLFVFSGNELVKYKFHNLEQNL